MKPIITSAKAVIIEDGKLLCVKCDDHRGQYYILPGGCMEPGETIPEALRRECREEIGADVIIHDLRFVRDFIGRNHEWTNYSSDIHKIELMFACSLVAGSECKPGIAPDASQVGVEWLPLDKLEDHRIYPDALKPYLSEMMNSANPVYLGDVN